MNENRIGWRHGLNGVFNSEFGHRSCQYFEIKQASNMSGGGAEQPPYMASAKPPIITIMSGFESPASAFYATERCMGFQQQHHSQVNDDNNNHPSLSSSFSKIYDLELPLYQSPRENPFLDHSPHQADSNVELSNTLQALVKSQWNTNQFCGSPQQPNKIPFFHVSEVSILPCRFKFNYLIFTVSFLLLQVGCGSYNLPVSHVSFSSQQEKEKLSPTVSTSGNPTSSGSGTVISSKTRIRWTQDLHEKFVECVNRLGGAESK